MTEPEEFEEPTFDSRMEELKTLRDRKIGFILDNNARAVTVLRGEAKRWEQIAGFYIDQAENALDLSGLAAELALETSKVTGDILITEFSDGISDEPTRLGDDNDDTESE